LQSASAGLLLVDAATVNLLYALEKPEVTRGGRGGRFRLPDSGYAFAWSPDGERIAWLGDQTALAITNSNSGKTELVLDLLRQEVKEQLQKTREELIERFGDRADELLAQNRGNFMLRIPEIESYDIAWSADGKWLAARVRTTSRSREDNTFHDLVVWDVSQPQAMLARRIPMINNQLSFGPYRSRLSFSPDATRLALQWSVSGWSDALQCWDTATGQLILDEQIEDLSEFLGWLPDGRSLALVLFTPREAVVRLGIQTVGRAATLREKLLHGVSGEIRLVGDRFHLADPQSQLLQLIDSALSLESTYLFVSDDAGDRQLVHMRSDGEFDTSTYTGHLKAVVLTNDGRQQILSAEEFNERLDSAPLSN
jgi:WD40 repeat protein